MRHVTFVEHRNIVHVVASYMHALPELHWHIKLSAFLSTVASAAWTTALAHYVSLLLGMLKHQLLHHSFTMATSTMETIAMAMDQVPDVIPTVGVAILSPNRDEATYHSKLQLMKDLFNRYPKHVRQ